jgi:hypothetical protein
MCLLVISVISAGVVKKSSNISFHNTLTQLENFDFILRLELLTFLSNFNLRFINI